jgi:hypothetical protein
VFDGQVVNIKHERVPDEKERLMEKRENPFAQGTFEDQKPVDNQDHIDDEAPDLLPAVFSS